MNNDKIQNNEQKSWGWIKRKVIEVWFHVCKTEKYMENMKKIIFRYVLICNMKRKEMMNRKIKIVVTSGRKKSEEEGQHQKEIHGLPR